LNQFANPRELDERSSREAVSCIASGGYRSGFLAE
jgi:hypothetical protein